MSQRETASAANPLRSYEDWKRDRERQGFCICWVCYGRYAQTVAIAGDHPHA